MFKVKVDHLVSQQKLTVSIFEREDGPDAKVTKLYNFTTQQVASAFISMGIQFSWKLIATEARQAEEWFHIAAATAETLDRIFRTREDLQRRVTVRMVNKTVTIDFID